MKRIISIISVLSILLGGTTSCKDWLEASSSTRLPDSKLLSDRDGFLSALSGIYIEMGSSRVFGGGLSFNGPDYAAQPYVYSATRSTKAFQEHEYQNTSVKTTVTQTWRYTYQSIANINLALSHLSEDKFTNDAEYNLVRGELLGLRAYLHFEIIRLWGTWDVTGTNAQKKTIPYVVTFDKEPTKQLSYEDTFRLLLADLNESITCLHDYDPIAGNLPESVLTSINTDGYWTNRQKHFNYYAALALKARYFQWVNDKQSAADLAKEVVAGADSSALVKWIDPEVLVSDVQDYYKDYSFSSEHIFSLEITNLTELASTLMIPTGGTIAGTCFPGAYIDDILYPATTPSGSTAGMEDVRGPAFQLRYNMGNYYCYKLYSPYSAQYRNRFPMISLPEMYYIQAENLIDKGDNAGALALLDEVRKHRGVIDAFPATAVAEDELMKEYYREMVNHGQLIYWLKHKQVTKSLYEPFILTGPKDLVFPYPDDEINYGRVQEL